MTVLCHYRCHSCCNLCLWHCFIPLDLLVSGIIADGTVVAVASDDIVAFYSTYNHCHCGHCCRCDCHTVIIARLIVVTILVNCIAVVTVIIHAAITGSLQCRSSIIMDVVIAIAIDLTAMCSTTD